MSQKLNDVTYEQILRLIQHAESQVQRGECQKAARTYLQALELLPKPIEQWEITITLYGRAADALFFDRDYDKAFELFRYTFDFAGASDNPFIKLRMGQCLVELDRLEEALPLLRGVRRQEGDEAFRDDDPKYLSFTKTGRLPRGRSYPKYLREQREAQDAELLPPIETKADS